MAEVVRFGPGQGTTETIPGDFILTHRHALYSWLVSHGQSIRFRKDRRIYAHWSHAALITSGTGDIIEARSKGVLEHTLKEYLHVEYHYVHLTMDDHDRAQAVKFAQACVGQEYGWGTIFGLAFCALTGSKMQFGFNGTEICSGLVARALERGDYIFPKAPNTMMPADLASYFKVTPSPHA